MTLSREQIERIRWDTNKNAGMLSCDPGDFQVLCDMAQRASDLERALMSAQAALAQREQDVLRLATALDHIYNENDEARAAVIAHYGLHHSAEVFDIISNADIVLRASRAPKGEQQTHTGAADE